MKSFGPTECELRSTINCYVDENQLLAIVRDELRHITLCQRNRHVVEHLRRSLSEFYSIERSEVVVAAGSTQVLDGLVQFFRDRLIVDIVPNFHQVRRASKRCRSAYQAVPVREPAELIDAFDRDSSLLNGVIFL